MRETCKGLLWATELFTFCEASAVSATLLFITPSLVPGPPVKVLHNFVNLAKAPYSESAELYSTVQTKKQNRELSKEFPGGKSRLNRNLID